MNDRPTCSHCGTQHSPDQRFCGACGYRLDVVCDACGASNAPDFRFCGACGTALHDAAAVRTGAEERRRVTVVFADLSGYTSLSERTDPEDVRELVDGCLGLLGEVVERHGGSVNQVMGDGIMALFGAPVAHEDDPERAVRAALEMQRRAADQADRFGGLPLRVGINTGEVMFAPLGPQGRREQTVTGDAVNVAARLQAAAPQAGILVGEPVHEATHRAIRYEPVPDLELKGKSRPVPAWLAIEAITPPAPRAVSSVPMVGRRAELDVLSSVWTHVRRDARPHLVTILGPPGIGKSRLTREFTSAVEAEGGRVLRGRSLPYGESTGYGSFAQQVKQAAGILESDASAEAMEKLHATIERLRPDDSTVAPRLAVLVGLDNERSVPDATSLVVSVRRFVEAVARETPTVFVFEDIHWADPSLCDLIETLAATAHEAAALFLTLARPELHDVRPRWGGGLAAYTTIPLQPLSDTETLELAKRLLAEHPEASGTTHRLIDSAGGNPLFLEEFAASLAQGAATAMDRIPTGVSAIISSRIDALPALERRIVLDASVVGRVFWRGILRRLVGGDDLDAAFATLENRDLIRRETTSRLAGDDEYAFKHILVREAAYAMLPRAVRRERHAVVARFIEDAAGDRTSEWASLLAHHWREANDPDRAVGYLLRAAEAAARAWANAEAVNQYTAALELIPAEDVDRRRAVRLRRALALVAIGDHRTARPAIEELLDELEGRDLIDALLAGGRASFWGLMDAEWTSNAGRRALELAEAIGAVELKPPALALVTRGMSMVQDVAESNVIGEQALADWSEDVHPVDLVFHLGQLATEYVWIGHFERAVELARRGFGLGMKLQVVDAIFAGSALGMALTGLGRHEEAIAELQRVVALGREVELVHAPRFTARTLNMLAGAFREIHDGSAARALNEEAIELGTRSGFLHPNIQGGIDLLYLDLERDDPSAAAKAWPKLWDDAHEVFGNFYPWLVQGRLVQAKSDIALALGDLDAALSAAGEAVQRAKRPGRTKYEALAAVTAGSALQRMGRLEEAVAELRRGAALAERLRHPPTLWRALSTLAAALYETGDDTGAEKTHMTVRDTITAFAAQLSGERRVRFLAAAPIAAILKVP